MVYSHLQSTANHISVISRLAACLIQDKVVVFNIELGRVMRKPVFCIWVKKVQISCAVTVQLIRASLFSLHSTIPLLSKIRNFKPLATSVTVQTSLCLTWSETLDKFCCDMAE